MIKKYLEESIKYLLRSRPLIEKYLKRIDKCYAMSPEELRQYKEREFLKLFRRAYDHSPFYHRLYSEAGITKEDITSLDDLQKLPVITKEMVKAHADEMLTIPKRRALKAHTSGTTGSPLMVYWDMDSVRHEQAYTYATRQRAGFRYGERLVSLRGKLTKEQKKLMVHASNTLFLSSYNINPDSAGDYYRWISDFKPKAIEGYPSSLYSLALMFRDAGLKVKVPVAFTSSETLFDYQRKLIEQQFQTEVFDHYGMTERTLYLFERNDHKGYYEAPGFAITEWLEDGEISTSLINSAFPLIRYRTNDIVEFANGDGGEDDGKMTITGVQGRAEDFIVCRDGSRVMRLGFVFKNVNHVRKAQIVAREPGKVDVNVVADEGFSEQDRQQISKNIEQRVGRGNLDFAINLITEEKIILTKNNKYKFIVDLQKAIGGGNLIKRIIGRTDDFIVCKDGSRMQRIDFAEDAEHVKAVQWVQPRKGELILCIVPDEGFTEADRDYVLKCTEERVGRGNLDIRVELKKIDELIHTSRGKFKLVVNLDKSVKS